MNVFLSFTKQDSDHAELLVSLLEFHGIEVWFSSNSLQSGRFPVEIRQALVSSDALIVLISKSAVSSKWVASEVLTFLEARPGAPILPAVIDGTKPGKVVKPLGEYQWFKFNLQGLVKLFKSLNVDFLQSGLSKIEKRVIADRRKGERRKTAPEIRLRKGFWFSYYRVKEPDKFEPISPSAYALIEMQEILLEEAKRYRFVDKHSGKAVPPESAVRLGSERVWHRMKQKPLGVIFVVEAIATEVCSAFEISALDRRQSADRRQVERGIAKGAAK